MFDFDMISLGLGVLAAIAAATLSAITLLQLRPQRLVGDESEYAAAPVKGLRHKRWIRTPGVRMLNAGFAATTGRSQRAAGRALSIIGSAGGIAFVVAIAHQEGGLWAALLTFIPMILMIERSILSIHLWPDPILSLLFAVFVVAVSANTIWVAGCVLALAVWIRIDCLGWSLIAIVGLVLFASNLSQWVLFALPSSAVLFLLSILNGRRHGVWLPDTTIGFNLGVWTRDGQTREISIEDLMSSQSRQDPVAARFAIAARCTALASRLRVLFGRETFVSDKLLLDDQARYAHRIGHVIRTNIAWGFSLLAFLAALVSPLSPVHFLASVFWVSIILVAVNTRSRYRQILAPVLSLVFGLGATNLLQGVHSPTSLAIGAALAIGAGLILYLAPRRREIEPRGSSR